jgi:plastocyanin
VPLKSRLLSGLGLAAIATSAIAVSAGADVTPNPRAKTAKVKVADDFFAPTDLTIKKGTKVKWKWDSMNTNTHNVVLTKKRPKGVKKGDFKSASGSVGVKFNRKFKKPGTYGFICTFHRSIMTMDVTVKK